MKRFLTPRTIAMVPLLAAAVWGSNQVPAMRGEQKPLVEQPPGRAFARSVLEDIKAGARLSAIELSERDDNMRLELVYAKNSAAQRFVLDFALDGTPRAFHRQSAPAPEELRIYRVERELANALEDGEVVGLEVGCDEYLMVTGNGTADKTPLHGVPVEPDDYYVVQERITGAGAGERAATSMLGASQQGFALIDLDSPGARAAELVWGDGVTKLSVHLRMNARGQISAVELRKSPSAEPIRTYRKEDEQILLRALAQAGSVESVRWQRRGQALDEADVPLELALGNHTTVVVDPDSFQSQY